MWLVYNSTFNHKIKTCRKEFKKFITQLISKIKAKSLFIVQVSPVKRALVDEGKNKNGRKDPTALN